MGFVMRIPVLSAVFDAVKEAGAEKARKKAKEKQTLDEIYDGKVNLKQKIEALSPENCPVEDIIPRFKSVIEDEYFRHFYEPTDLFVRLHPDIEKYTSRPMTKLFMEMSTANASRILPEDAVDFVRTLFVGNSFSRIYGVYLEPLWTKTQELKDFFSHGLVPLAAKVHPEDKIKFFRACETELYLKIFVEVCNPEDVAAFLYNIFGEMKAGDVDAVLVQTDIMEYLPNRGNADEYAKAFDSFCTAGMDSRLPYVFKKHIGWKPAGGHYYPSFEDHYPPEKDDGPDSGSSLIIT